MDDYLHATIDQVKNAHRQLSPYSYMRREKTDYSISLYLVRKDGSIPEQSKNFEARNNRIVDPSVRNCLSVRGKFVYFIDNTGSVFCLYDDRNKSYVEEPLELIKRLSPEELALKTATSDFRCESETSTLEDGIARFYLDQFPPAKSFDQVKIKRIVNLNDKITVLRTERNGHDMLLVHFSMGQSVSSGYGGYVFEGEITIYYSIIDCIALSSTGEEYSQAFISTTQGLQELDGFY